MALGRVRRGPFSRCVAGALLLAGSALWEPAGAQYGGFGFPFFGNPWFNKRPGGCLGATSFRDVVSRAIGSP